MKQCKIVLVLFLVISGVHVNAQKDSLLNKGFVKLFNEKNWEGWDLKLRSGDSEKAKEVYAIEEGIVHVFKHMPDSLNFLPYRDYINHEIFQTTDGKHDYPTWMYPTKNQPVVKGALVFLGKVFCKNQK